MGGALGTTERAWVMHREDVMGTVVTLDVLLVDQSFRGSLAPRLEEAVAELNHIDEVLSTWKPDSAISRLRFGEITLTEAPEEVLEVLNACLLVREATWGWFDPWAMPGGVDPTGFVKGWVAQRALRHLVGDGVIGAIVNAAGDIATAGANADGTAFRVGITNPFNRSSIAFVIDVTGAVATSGTYERGEHIVQPSTGEAMAAAASATVVGPDLGWADALATALCAGGVDVLPAIDDIDSYEALVVTHDGSIFKTGDFPLITADAATAPPSPSGPTH
jgi:thiamine biosynthesis lipoprotein